ncbi:DUF2877 domain-containing protein [Nocardioides mangrovicus]|uniref:DUF2877 domain-containing protein n=1 Tax=Nocardioides mangrovicus TaxID=2478913 RepID=A0A3L8P792_9ACTN|nr:DUF2877 domain-containing protein [Nocardioides mangrovicus]
MLAAAAGPRTAMRLAGPRRELSIVHRGHDALYLDLGGWCLGVVRPPAVQVPCALVLGPDAEIDLAGVETATADDSELELDGVRVRIARFRDVRVPRITAIHPEAAAVLSAHASPASEELGEVSDPVSLVGRGSGLTPLGDDVLAGRLATSYALGVPATVPYDVRGATTLLSATLVDCAARGEVLPQFRDVVVGLGDPASLGAAAERLAAVGHTSGAGLLLGASLELEHGGLAA